jgi:hypothetical protein
MLYGMMAMALLWLATRFLAAWPAGFDIPVIWPALLAASLVAWTQALTWMPYALPGLRVIVTILWLASIDAVVMVALELKTSEGVMLAVLAPNVPLAYLTARFAIARARRGDIPDWREMFVWLGRIANVLPRARNQFPSPARAQEWFEWRQHGRSLPAMVGILLPFELALLAIARETPVIVFETLALVLLTPPFMATFVAATVSKSNLNGSDSYGVTPFIATRPMTSSSLVAAKLKVASWSTIAAWLLVLIAIPIALRLSGTLPTVIDWAHRLIEVVGTPRAIAIALLGFSALVATTWKQLVQGLYIGMSGREWAVKANVFVALTFLAIIFPLADWIFSSRARIAAWGYKLPWIAAVLVCLKISVAVWIAARLHDSRLISDRTIVVYAICWDVIVFALYGLMAWIFPTMIFRSDFLALIAILAIPLARVSAAPLALAWNRHR